MNFESTQNVYIEGDNLEVLKLLQRSYFNRVKLIYIDPPYNTGHDFVYEDDFRDPLERYRAATSQTTRSNPEYMGRFHTRWLNMMYPRLKMAANLLRDDGVIFISIDDHEVHNLRKLCDEVFGEENFVSELIWKNGATSASHFCTEHEYILAYAYRKESLPLFLFNGEDMIIERAVKRPSYKNPVSEIEFKAGIDFLSPNRVFPNLIGDAEPIRVVQGVLEAKNGKLANDVVLEAAWTMRDMILSWLSGEMVFDQKGQKIKRFFFKANGVLHYEKERGTVHPKSVIEGFTTKSGSKSLMSLGLSGFFNFPKPVALLSYLIGVVSKDDDIILDFFSGSATTAHAVMQLNAEDGGNRRFIMVQLPELCPENSEAAKVGYPNICEIGKERIRRAGRKILEAAGLNTGNNEQNNAKDKQFSLIYADFTDDYPLIPPTHTAGHWF